MEQMLYELSSAESRLEEITRRIKNYVGNDSDYVAQMAIKRSEIQVKITKIQKAIELFKEAVTIGY